jgi:hypothetical protein
MRNKGEQAKETATINLEVEELEARLAPFTITKTTDSASPSSFKN